MENYKIKKMKRTHIFLYKDFRAIGHFTVVYLVARPLIWSEAEGDLVMIETSI